MHRLFDAHHHPVSWELVLARYPDVGTEAYSGLGCNPTLSGSRACVLTPGSHCPALGPGSVPRLCGCPFRSLVPRRQASAKYMLSVPWEARCRAKACEDGESGFFFFEGCGVPWNHPTCPLRQKRLLGIQGVRAVRCLLFEGLSSWLKCP